MLWFWIGSHAEYDKLVGWPHKRSVFLLIYFAFNADEVQIGLLRR